LLLRSSLEVQRRDRLNQDIGIQIHVDVEMSFEISASSGPLSDSVVTSTLIVYIVGGKMRGRGSGLATSSHMPEPRK